MLKREVNIILNALVFYTRLPVPKSIVCNEQSLAAALRYLPSVGLLVGGLSALLYGCLIFIVPREIAIIAVMAFSILLTGAFHEDGLADFADGFGGGYGKERIMSIMKDSFIGSYGVIALILGLGGKYVLLTHLPEPWVAPALVIGPAVSRFAPLVLVRFSSYARLSNGKGMQNRMGIPISSLCFAALTSLPLCFYFVWMVALGILLLELILCLWMYRYTLRLIGGYTGDCLGALQQLEELLFYFLLLALPNLIALL